MCSQIINAHDEIIWLESGEFVFSDLDEGDTGYIHTVYVYMGNVLNEQSLTTFMQATVKEAKHAVSTGHVFFIMILPQSLLQIRTELLI